MKPPFFFQKIIITPPSTASQGYQLAKTSSSFSTAGACQIGVESTQIEKTSGQTS